MLGDALLLDSSVWICYLRPRQWEDLKTAVQEALTQGRVATCWAVNCELLIGARDEPAFDILLEAIRAVPEVPLTPAVWEEAAQLGYRLRKQGLLVPLPDLLIAQCAISSGRVLWHADEDFERIRRLTSLQTRHWRVSG